MPLDSLSNRPALWETRFRAAQRRRSPHRARPHPRERGLRRRRAPPPVSQVRRRRSARGPGRAAQGVRDRGRGVRPRPAVRPATRLDRPGRGGQGEDQARGVLQQRRRRGCGDDPLAEGQLRSRVRAALGRRPGRRGARSAGAVAERRSGAGCLAAGVEAPRHARAARRCTRLDRTRRGRRNLARRRESEDRRSRVRRSRSCR